MITHWKQNNYIRSDRYVKSTHAAELTELENLSGKYVVNTALSDVGIPVVNQTVDHVSTTCHTQNRIEENSNKNNKHYSVFFEQIWSAYPRKKEKAKAYKCYKARLGDGYSEEQLLGAVKRYVEECKRLKTEERFIKHMGTFFGPNMPFIDYLEEKVEVNDDSGGRDGCSLQLW